MPAPPPSAPHHEPPPKHAAPPPTPPHHDAPPPKHVTPPPTPPHRDAPPPKHADADRAASPRRAETGEATTLRARAQHGRGWSQGSGNGWYRVWGFDIGDANLEGKPAIRMRSTRSPGSNPRVRRQGSRSTAARARAAERVRPASMALAVRRRLPIIFARWGSPTREHRTSVLLSLPRISPQPAGSGEKKHWRAAIVTSSRASNRRRRSHRRRIEDPPTPFAPRSAFLIDPSFQFEFPIKGTVPLPPTSPVRIAWEWKIEVKGRVFGGSKADLEAKLKVLKKQVELEYKKKFEKSAIEGIQGQRRLRRRRPQGLQEEPQGRRRVRRVRRPHGVGSRGERHARVHLVRSKARNSGIRRCRSARAGGAQGDGDPEIRARCRCGHAPPPRPNWARRRPSELQCRWSVT